MFFKHIYEEGLAQSSYMLGCQKTGEAIVIDPRRDIEVYIELAEKEKFNIKFITETHIHADFLSGSRELQAASGAKLLLSDEGGVDWQYQFHHEGLKNGSIFYVGNLKFEVLHTPGHTPEHISFLVTDTVVSTKPVMIFTGDFMFVGDVGRPDLLEKAAGMMGTKEESARHLFESLKKFKEIDDFVQVWPGHGAGSACGKNLGAIPSSTVGYEKLVNWALNIKDENQFIEILLEGQPEPPRYFAEMKRLNKTGPTLLGGLPHPARLTLTQFKNALDKSITLIDTRDKLSFAGGHVRGAININDNLSFSTWAGWLLNYNEPFILVAPEHRISELTKALIRIGLDNIYGYIADMDAWANTCHELETVDQITVMELKEKMTTGDIQIIDVRGAEEYKSGYINKAENIHAGYIPSNLHKLNRDKLIVVQCLSGNRSSLASSLLLKAGFSNVMNLTGGITAWEQEGFEIAQNGIVEEETIV